jgi:glycosyltransferase involved in cell wall biosynthesis
VDQSDRNPAQAPNREINITLTLTVKYGQSARRREVVRVSENNDFTGDENGENYLRNSKWSSARGGMNKISVIIPTLNRPKHLRNAIRSILAQTRLPDEVIVVDQNDDLEAENLITKERSLLTKKVSLKYIFEREKNASRARNVGWRAATGQIVIFLDDDMILDRRFISEILRVYREHPHAVGVQGTWSGGWPNWKANSFVQILLNNIRKVFLVTHWEKESQRMLPSKGMVVPFPLARTIEAEVILIGLVSFRKVTEEDFCFDENLKANSARAGEESFTIGLNRRYPHSLYVTPFAKAIRDPTSATDADQQTQSARGVYVRTQYELYNFNKNINLLGGSPLRNWIAFVLKTVGETIILIALMPARSHHKEYRIRLFYTVQSYLRTLSHFNEVRTGKLNLMIHGRHENTRFLRLKHPFHVKSII